MKKLIAIALLVVAISLLMVALLSCIDEKKLYRMTIVFCDGRPPKQAFVWSYEKPSNEDIHTVDRAKPVLSIYGSNVKEINVCDVTNVEEVAYRK